MLKKRMNIHFCYIFVIELQYYGKTSKKHRQTKRTDKGDY